jgi:GxxExxY protein
MVAEVLVAKIISPQRRGGCAEIRREKRREKRRGVETNKITHAVIGAAIEVHRHLGPGLLESAYDECLAREMIIRAIPFERQYPLPVEYKGVRLDCGYRLDYLVAKQVVLELKAVETVLPVHEAQLLTYLQIGGWQAGLLINFNVEILKNGIFRKVNGLKE